MGTRLFAFSIVILVRGSVRSGRIADRRADNVNELPRGTEYSFSGYDRLVQRVTTRSLQSRMHGTE
jgi:hypothetical protein